MFLHYLNELSDTSQTLNPFLIEIRPFNLTSNVADKTALDCPLIASDILKNGILCGLYRVVIIALINFMFR